MSGFRAIVVTRDDKGYRCAPALLQDSDLMDADVTVAVTHSTVNFKDGLAVTGKAPVVRRFPMVPGIDFAGDVVASSHPDFAVGDPVVLNGWGVGETHLGGFAERARVKGDWLIKRPAGLSAAQCMAIGTAGYTAALAILALEKHGLDPSHGPAVVTGAAGGVGSIATALLAQAGWHVIATTGRPHEADYLKSLGAAEIVDRAELASPAKPLNKERWAAGVDCVGSTTLANLLSMTRYGGAIAACGLAGGMDLPSSVAPFILRAVSLLGIDSVMASRAARLAAWQRLDRDLDRTKLAAITTTIPLEGAIDAAHDILDGKVRGRVVVEMASV